MSDKPPASVALWMPWFIKEHRSKASTLSHTEHSVLTYLLMQLWEGEGTIPDDDAWIARRVRLTPRQWKAMRAIILEDCVIANGTISHPVLLVEIEKARANVEQKRKAGRASAAARKANARSTAVPTAVQPRAGSGEGEGPSQGIGLGDTLGDRPFRVVEGGQ